MEALRRLFPEAEEGVLAAEEDAVVGQGKAGPVAPHGQVTELDAVQRTELFRIGSYDEDFAVVVLEVDLAVSTGGRGLDLGAGADFTGPEDLSTAGFDAGEALVFELAIQYIEVAVVVEGGWDIGGDFFILALPEKLAGLHVDRIDWAFLGSTG